MYVTLSDVYIKLEHLYFWQKGKELLRDIAFSLNSGDCVGLVGPNGSGKSTLLKLITGELLPESGSVIRSPGLRQVRLEQSPIFTQGTVWQVASQALQEIQRLEQQLRAEEQNIAQGAGLETYHQLTEAFEHLGGYQAETQLEKMLEQFGFSREQQVATLSGGEQMRLALARVLVSRPDVLLLDEPTNHLDLSAKKHLAKLLTHYPGALLIASHDRAFLDQVSHQTAFLKDGQLKIYKGNYSRALMQRNKQDATSFPSITKINIQPRVAKQVMVTAKHLSKTLDGKLLLEDLSFRLEAGDKVALLGANGSGKSTLLKMLSGQIESDLPEMDIHLNPESKLFYFDQQYRGVNDLPVLDQLTAFVTLERARMLLALVDIPKEYWLSSPQILSPGQRARVGIAKMLASEANLLLLDEPTNDLDIRMIELLENTLASSEVTCLFVTHDERLLETLATQVLELEGAKLKPYSSLKDYAQDRPQPILVEQDMAGDAQIETPEQTLERLELERNDWLERLFDPLAFSERDYLRAQSRLQELEDELSVLYDQPLPRPLPYYQTRASGIYLGADHSEGQIHFTSDVPVDIKLVIQNGIGHLVLVEPQNSCLLQWARDRLIMGLLRLCFLYFNVQIIQHQSEVNLLGTMLQPAGENWWTLHRKRFERLEGWVQRSKSRNRGFRRKRKGARPHAISNE